MVNNYDENNFSYKLDKTDVHSNLKNSLQTISGQLKKIADKIYYIFHNNKDDEFLSLLLELDKKEENYSIDLNVLYDNLKILNLLSLKDLNQELFNYILIKLTYNIFYNLFDKVDYYKGLINNESKELVFYRHKNVIEINLSDAILDEKWVKESINLAISRLNLDLNVSDIISEYQNDLSKFEENEVEDVEAIVNKKVKVLSEITYD